jgi:hypothetical protein
MLNLPRYEDILNDKKDANRELISAKVAQASARANLKIAQIDEDLKTRQARLKEVCMSPEVDFDVIIELLDDIETVERTKGQYEAIVDQMFAKKSAAKKA